MRAATLLLGAALAGCAPTPVVLLGSEATGAADTPRPATLVVSDPHAPATTPAELMLASGSRYQGALARAQAPPDQTPPAQTPPAQTAPALTLAAEPPVARPGDWHGTMGAAGGLQFSCLLRITDPSRGLEGGAVGTCDDVTGRRVLFVY